MWHLSMKIFDMFGQTPPHTLDKIMAKLIPMKTDLKDHSKKAKDDNLGNKNKLPLKKTRPTGLLLTCQTS